MHWKYGNLSQGSVDPGLDWAILVRTHELNHALASGKLTAEFHYKTWSLFVQ